MITLSSPRSGGEGAHRAVLLALLTLIEGCFTGCRHPVVLPPARHSVRMTALLPLHPAWAQVVALDAQLGKAATLPPLPSITPTPLPETFIPPGGLPPNLIASQEKIVHEDAAHYIAQQESALDLRARELVNAKQMTEEQLAATRYKLELEKREQRLREANKVEAAQIVHLVHRLEDRFQALDSQIRVYSASGVNARRLIDDARQQQTVVTQQIEAKNTEIEGLLHADFHGLAEAAMQSYRKQLDTELQANIKQFAIEQVAHDQQELDHAKERLNSLPTVIPALADHAGELNNPHAVALVLPPMPSQTPDYTQAQASITTAQQHWREQLTAQRSTLLALIRQDTQKAVEQIARKQGWKLAAEGKADDWTQKVIPELQAQWNRGAVN